MDDDSREILDKEIIMTKLSESASYCEVKLDGVTTKVVVVSGMPIPYRSFCMLSLACVSGGVYAYIDNICRDIKDFWEIIDFNGPSTSETWMAFSEYYATNPYGIIVKAIMTTSGGEENADLYPLLEKVGNEAADYQ